MTNVSPKKISAVQFSWYIFFFCGVIIPSIALFFMNLIIENLPISLSSGDTIPTIINVILLFLVIWFGIKYYLQYAHKKYILSDKKELIRNIIITFTAWSILGLILYFFLEKPDFSSLLSSVIIAIIEIGIVYFALKKFLKIS